MKIVDLKVENDQFMVSTESDGNFVYPVDKFDSYEALKAEINKRLLLSKKMVDKIVLRKNKILDSFNDENKGIEDLKVAGVY